MISYSYDLGMREELAVDQGRPRAEIVIMFDLSLDTIKH